MADTQSRFCRRTFLRRSSAAGFLATTALAAHHPARATTPVPASLSADLETTITGLMESMVIPGATVLIGQSGNEPWVRSFGVADLATDTPMDPAMHVRIGSITKTMTATVVLQLVDEGAIDLDDTLTEVLPDISAFPHAATMTVRHMLSMRSGAIDYLEDPSVFQKITENPTRVWTPDELIDTSLVIDPRFAPGEKFAYSNTNYILLGMILEHVTGSPLADTLDQRIFQPLEMEHSSLPERAEMPEPFARGYGVGIVEDSATPASGTLDGLRDWTELHPSVAGAAGGIVSTLDDLHRWLAELQEGTLLSDELHEQRLDFTRVELGAGQPSFSYGLGIGSYDGLIGHDGSIFGYENFMGHDPETGTSIIALLNVSPSPAGASAFALTTAIRESRNGHASDNLDP